MDTTIGIKCGKTLSVRSVENHVSGNSQTTTVGIDAKKMNVEQEKTVVENLGEPQDLKQQEVQGTQGPAPRERSLKRENSGENEDSGPDLATLKSGTYGIITRKKHTVEKDQEIRVINPGNGHVVAQYNHGDLKVGGKQTTILDLGQNPTSDSSIFNICKPAEDGCYKLVKPSCALIINNIFNGNNSDPNYKQQYREGAEGDTEKLRKLFNYLNFGYVVTKENVASDKLKGILEKFRGEIKDEDYSSCFIIIMSHGGKGVNSILMDDLNDRNELNEVDLYNDIVYEFSKHEEVRSRPKVFLVQACRDSKGPPAVPGRLDKLPSFEDVLIGHSTSPYFVAGRDKKTGAVYFEAIDQVFREKAQGFSLQSLLSEVYNHESLKKLQQYAPVELYGFKDYRFQV